MKEQNELVEIDLIALGKAVLKRIWIVIIVAVLGVVLSFSYAKIFVTPLYQARATMYVNNASSPTGDKISTADISAAQSLVKTYIVILESKDTLNAVIEKANLPYSSGELRSMISANAVNQTEILEIKVTNSNPETAQLISNTIVEVLPEKISEVVEGSSVKIIDTADFPSSPISPNVKKFVMLGFLLGAFISVGVIVLLELFNKKVNGDEYLRQTYDIPILCSVPDISEKRK